MPFISPKRLLYYCPASIAGTARNAIEQAIALGRAGVEVTFLAPTDFDYVGETPNVIIDRCLRPGPRSGRSARWLSRMQVCRAILTNQSRLRKTLRASGIRHVMFASYSEYLAPLWAPWLRRLQRQGVRFVANLLDPVRDYVVGPIWWHQWSVNEGYSFLSGVFVHQAIELDVHRSHPQLVVTVVPHGAYHYPGASRSRAETRQQYGIPEDAYLLLAFGHIRDNKNLHLVLEAMASVPWAHLLVAGTEAPPGQTSAADYQALAAKLGVAPRVHWRVGYIPDEEVAGIFGCADCLVMTYSKTFLSVSGILFVAAPLRIPVLVSGGDSPLCNTVEKYALGYRIESDSVPAIVAGLNRMRDTPATGQWDVFMSENSYSKAADIIIKSLFGA